MLVSSCLACLLSLATAIAAQPAAQPAQPAAQPAAPGHADADPADLYRPAYHFTPPRNWMNDPNGLVYADGEYHLFYQYNPHGITWGHMSWGHAVSTDLLSWQHLPVAIPEANGVMAFSGSAVVDHANTSGLGTAATPPLVAIYTGHRPADGHQSQYIASSTDRGRTWNIYPANPVIDINSNNFRDPKVQWDEPRRRWTMVVALSEERKVRFYASPDLKTWEQTGEFGPAGSREGVWECPDLFELPVANSPGAPRGWVLIVSVGWGGPQGGNGVQYFVGDFDGQTFTPDPAWDASTPHWLEKGRDFYASVTWNDVPVLPGDPEPRRILLGWMVNGEYAGSTPTFPWRSAMSVPRELALHRADGAWCLAQSPVREIDALRSRHCRTGPGDIPAVNTWIGQMSLRGACLDLSVTFRLADTGNAAPFGLSVRKGETEETRIGYDPAAATLFVDRSRPGNVGFHPAFAHRSATPLKLADGRLSLRVLVDISSVEVFADDGRTVLTSLIYPARASEGVELWSEGPGVRVESLECWQLDAAEAP
ncbi:MAG: Levanase [Phycisphaerales bacterium]|nr:Levanase [Phycisphaerales bacterium]